MTVKLLTVTVPGRARPGASDLYQSEYKSNPLVVKIRPSQ